MDELIHVSKCGLSFSCYFLICIFLFLSVCNHLCSSVKRTHSPLKGNLMCSFISKCQIWIWNVKSCLRWNSTKLKRRITRTYLEVCVTASPLPDPLTDREMASLIKNNLLSSTSMYTASVGSPLKRMKK